MSSSDDSRERLLEQVISGEIDKDSPPFLEAMENDPSLARDVRELDAIKAALAEEASIEKAILSGETMTRPTEQATEQAHVVRPWRLIFAGAAAALLLAWLTGAFDSTQAPVDPGPVLGTGTLEIEALTRTQTGGLVLVWDPSTSGSDFVVQIWNASQPRGSDPILERRFEQETQWTLTPNDSTSLESRIRVAISERDRVDQEIASVRGELSLPD